MSKKRRHLNDLLLILFFIIITIIGSILIFSNSLDTNLYVEIRVDGNVLYSLPFGEDASYNIEKKLDIGNYLVIKDGYVYLQDASCPDRLCVKQGRISRVNQSIICLPHKLVIQIITKDNRTDTGLDIQP